MAQLLIRPSLNDHHVAANLLAPSPAPTLRARRPPIHQLVADAHIALQRPTLAESAREAGIPSLVDPNTPLLQGAVDPTGVWAKLPFLAGPAKQVDDIDVDQLVETVVQFQAEQGATRIIPPYLYADDPSDPAFSMSIRLMAATAHYLDEAHIPLPITAIFCGQLNNFAKAGSPHAGLRRFLSAANDHDVATVGMCLSPLGAPDDSYAKVGRLFRLAAIARSSAVPVIAWRQGIYGPALVAAGLSGYETGIGVGEQTNITAQARNRRPKEDDKKKPEGGPANVFLEPLGRSVPKSVAQALLESREMGPRVMCDDEGCCASVGETLGQGRRSHAVRNRARQLHDLAEQPHPRWRLHHIAQHAAMAGTLARQANKFLETQGVKQRIGSTNLDALARVTSELGQADEGSLSA